MSLLAERAFLACLATATLLPLPSLLTNDQKYTASVAALGSLPHKSVLPLCSREGYILLLRKGTAYLQVICPEGRDPHDE